MRLSNFHLNLDLDTGELRLYDKAGPYHIIPTGTGTQEFVVKRLAERLKDIQDLTDRDVSKLTGIASNASQEKN